MVLRLDFDEFNSILFFFHKLQKQKQKDRTHGWFPLLRSSKGWSGVALLFVNESVARLVGDECCCQYLNFYCEFSWFMVSFVNESVTCLVGDECCCCIFLHPFKLNVAASTWIFTVNFHDSWFHLLMSLSPVWLGTNVVVAFSYTNKLNVAASTRIFTVNFHDSWFHLLMSLSPVWLGTNVVVAFSYTHLN